MNNENEIIIKKIALILHKIWKQEKETEGFHFPRLCPTYESKENDDEESDLIHCNKCLSNLCDYNDLPEYKKNEYLKKAENLIKLYEENGLKIKLN